MTRLTWSPKGDLAPIDDFDRQLERFEDGEFITSLTPALQSGLVALNAFAHAAGLEVGNFFDDSAPHVNAEMREYAGEPSHLNPQEIPPALLGNEIGQCWKLDSAALLGNVKESCTDSTGARL